jgi:hypothetical protein
MQFTSSIIGLMPIPETSLNWKKIIHVIFCNSEAADLDGAAFQDPYA